MTMNGAVGLDEVHYAEGFVDADKGFFVGGWCAFDEGEVGFAGEFVDVNVLLELAPRGLYGCVTHVFEQAFGTAAVFDEVGNGADFEIVFFGEFHQFGHARHGAVVVDDFADDGGGNQAVHLCQVNAGFVCPARTSTPPFGHAVGRCGRVGRCLLVLADGETAV